MMRPQTYRKLASAIRNADPTLTRADLITLVADALVGSHSQYSRSNFIAMCTDPSTKLPPRLLSLSERISHKIIHMRGSH